MPDVGSLRLKAYKQRKLPRDQRDDDLEENASDDLTAYVCYSNQIFSSKIKLFYFIGIFIFYQ